MKRIFAILVAVLAISSVAFAQAPALPNYVKDGKVVSTYACDAGKTTVKAYGHKEWWVDEARTASDDVFVDVFVASSQGFFMQLAGSKEMKKVTHKEWDEALLKSAPAYFYDLHGGGKSDCN